jgi:hypothetical protein
MPLARDGQKCVGNLKCELSRFPFVPEFRPFATAEKKTPPEALEYRIGNRPALEWVIDQYQVSTDKQSGIVSDPNREDDPQYIVRLVGQVIRVSLETVQIVKGLPAEFEPK